MKYIRELRMGQGKQFKTGSVVGSYPRPLLVLNFDESGLDIIKDPIVLIKPDEFEGHCKMKSEDLAPITAVDLCDTQVKVMTEAYQPLAASAPFQSFIKIVNHLVKTGCPWKTVVVDSISGLGDCILAHVAATNASSLGSALKWAPMVGGKIHQCLGVMTGINTNIVFICHCSAPVTDETTKAVSVVPLVPSQWMRDRIGTLVSQFLYQVIEGGKAYVYTTNSDVAFVKGVGCRWPENLPSKVLADYKSIYETTYPARKV